MATNSEVNEIQVNIPSEKLNDLEFLQHKLLEVSFRALKEISEHSDKTFIELVTEFIPDETCINNAFLEEWGLTKEDLNFKTEKKMKTRKKMKKMKKNTPVKKTKSTKKPIKTTVNDESTKIVNEVIAKSEGEEAVPVTTPPPAVKDEPVQVNTPEPVPVKKPKIRKKKKLKRKKLKTSDAGIKATKLKKEAEEAAKEPDINDDVSDDP